MLELVKPWPRLLPGIPLPAPLAMGWSIVAVEYHYSDQRTAHCENEGSRELAVPVNWRNLELATVLTTHSLIPPLSSVACPIYQVLAPATSTGFGTICPRIGTGALERSPPTPTRTA